MNDGSVYDRQVIKEGEMPLAPTVNPTKPSTDEYSYIFKGWDADGDGNVDEITAATVEGATFMSRLTEDGKLGTMQKTKRHISEVFMFSEKSRTEPNRQLP